MMPEAHVFLMNERSFTWLFNSYWEKVYAVCYQNIGSHEDAKELTQNIFKSLWERRSEIRITGSAEHYLMRSAKLQVINFYRDAKTRRTYQESMEQTYRDAESSTENQVFFNQLNEKVNLLVDSLSGQCQTIYRLSREEHLANKEIADRLNISLSTVEYHLNNASKLLRTNLRQFI